MAWTAFSIVLGVAHAKLLAWYTITFVGDAEFRFIDLWTYDGGGVASLHNDLCGRTNGSGEGGCGRLTGPIKVGTAWRDCDVWLLERDEVGWA